MVTEALANFAFILGISVGLMSLILILWGVHMMDHNKKIMMMSQQFRLDYQKFQLSREEIRKYNQQMADLNQAKSQMGEFRK
jgi:hypothetical protein